jgi:hypothetical protein
MKFSECSKVRSSFSPYLDGAVSGREMQRIEKHLGSCSECHQEFEQLRAMQHTLSSLGPARPPADLAVRLRVAISHQRAAQRTRWIDKFSVRWENAIRPLLVQVSAGFASSVALVGIIMLLLGVVASPEPVMANDEPIGAMTAPHYLYSAVAPGAIVTTNDSAIVVDAYVNENGQVYDYNIVSGPTENTVKNQVVAHLLLSVFEPARVFGMPVRGRVVLTFSGISVRG